LFRGQRRQGYFGNSGTSIAGPGANNWDVSLEKSFPLPANDPVRLMLRLDAGIKLLW
jgi:hypothetical protein